MTNSSKVDVDVAIVGAGAAGLYATLRLTTSKAATSIALFEAHARPGGRVLSVPMGASGKCCELGAMRFMKHHVLVHAMAQYLNLKSERFHFPVHAFHLRGRTIKYIDGKEDLRGLSPRFDDLYAVNQDERGRSPVELIRLAMCRACNDIADELDVQDGHAAERHSLASALRQIANNGPETPWPVLGTPATNTLRRLGVLTGIPLYEIGFWHLLQFYLSSEAFHLVRDGLGYYTVTSEWNAADALARFLDELRPGSEYDTLSGGMSAIIDGMLLRATATSVPVHIFRSHMLRTVTKQDGGVYELSFIAPIDKDAVLTRSPRLNSGNTHVVTYRARRLMLCMSAQALQAITFVNMPTKVSVDNAQADEDRSGQGLKELLSEGVLGWPLQKFVFAYNTPWWQTKYGRLPLPEGNGCLIITDLPARQIFFRTEKEGERSYIMFYVDGPPLSAWESLRRHGTLDDAPPGIGGHEGREGRVPLRMIRKANRMLANILNIDSMGIPLPVAASMRTWGDWPDWAGWHAWRIGSQSWKTRALLADLCLESGTVAVCGEAFSGIPGWIEGAFQSVEHAMHEWRIPSPEWTPYVALDDRKCTELRQYACC